MFSEAFNSCLGFLVKSRWFILFQLELRWLNRILAPTCLGNSDPSPQNSVHHVSWKMWCKMAENLPVTSPPLHQQGWSICPNQSNSSSIRLSNFFSTSTEHTLQHVHTPAISRGQLLLPSCCPWMIFRVPSGAPASWNSLARNMSAPGTRSDGFIKKVFPHTIAMGNIQRGIMAGKLNGAIPAHTPRGRR